MPALRGHQFKMVSGQGKWQEWMPKLERSRLDLRKPCYPQRAGIPGSEEHGSRSHPDNVWFRRDGRAPLRGGFSEPRKPQGTWEDRGRVLSITFGAVCCLLSSMLQGGPRQQSNVIVARRHECLPCHHGVFLIYIYTESK